MVSLDVVWGQVELTTVFIVVLVFLLGYYWLTTPSNLPPGPFPWPVVGNLITLSKAWKQNSGLSLFKKWRQRFGDVFTFWMAGQPVIVISDYKLLQEAFVKQGDIFSGRAKDLYIFRKINSITGLGVLNGDGPQWRELRRVTLMSMRDFGLGKVTLEQRVQEEAREVMAALDAGQGRPRVLKTLFSSFSSNVVCSLIFGKRFESSNEVFQEMITLVAGIASRLMLFHPSNFFRIYRHIPSTNRLAEDQVADFRALDALLKNQLKDHEASFDLSDVRDFVDLYLKTRSESADNTHMYTAENLRRVIMDLFIAGTETSATTLEWLVLYMVASPEVQARCQQEIDKVIGQDRMVTSQDRKKLPYIEAVITEVSRLASIVPIVPHVAHAEGEIGGYRVPKGAILMANLREIHHDPRAWPQPETFDPDRFLDKDGQFRLHKENYVPFSIGPRICVGESLARLETFILFTTLLQRYTVAMEPGLSPSLEGHVGITYSAAPQAVVVRRR